MFPGSGIQDVVYEQLMLRRAADAGELGGVTDGDFFMFQAETYSVAESWLAPGGYHDVTTTLAASRRVPVTRNGTLSRLRVQAESAAVGSGSTTYEVWIEPPAGGAFVTALKCTILAASNPHQGSDLVHTVAIPEGYRLLLHVFHTGTVSPKPARVKASFLYLPD